MVGVCKRMKRKKKKKNTRKRNDLECSWRVEKEKWKRKKKGSEILRIEWLDPSFSFPLSIDLHLVLHEILKRENGGWVPGHRGGSRKKNKKVRDEWYQPFVCAADAKLCWIALWLLIYPILRFRTSPFFFFFFVISTLLFLRIYIDIYVRTVWKTSSNFYFFFLPFFFFSMLSLFHETL